MTYLKALLLLAVLLLTWGCSPVDVSGGETTNQASIGITVYRADGKTVASGATIKLFIPGDTSKTPIDQSELDENGQYNPAKLKLSGNSPYHNVVIEYDSAEALFYDSVFITQENLTYLKTDTLAPVGAIAGTVKIQPNHTPIAVLVHALGTDIYTKADGITGEFTIGGLGEGTYNLMFTCLYEGYDIELFDTLAVSGKTTVIADTIEIPYLNIPVVEGIASSYDTLAGVTTLSWEKTGYSSTLFAGYEVFRTTDLTNWPTTAMAIVRDTVFNDTLDALGGDSLYYRVRVINQSGLSGLPFGATAIKPVSPIEATTTFNTLLYHVKKQKVVTACSINDSMTVHFGFSNPSRTFSAVSVSNVGYEKTFETPVSSYSDSVSLFVTHDTSVVVTVIDNHGEIWSQTVVINVVQDAPRIISMDSIITLKVLDTIHVVVDDEYGEIVRYEWDLNGDNIIDGNNKNFAAIIDTLCASLKFTYTLWDDDGNKVSHTFTVISTLAENEISNLPTNICYYFFTLDSTFFILDSEQFLWSSEDGVIWNKSVTKLPFKTKKVLQVNDQYFALEQRNVLSGHNVSDYIIHMSSDLENWQELSAFCNLKSFLLPFLDVIDGKMYSNFIDTTNSTEDIIVNNKNDTAYHAGPLFESADGKTWTEREGLSVKISNIDRNAITVVTEHNLLAYYQNFFESSMTTNTYNSDFEMLHTQKDLLLSDEPVLLYNAIMYKKGTVLSTNTGFYYHDLSTKDAIPLIKMPNAMGSHSIIKDGKLYYIKDGILYMVTL